MGEGKAGSGGLALILLLVLIGLGGWNYHRNYQLELAERSQETFSGYDTESLEQLAEAYRLEAAALESQYQKLRGARSSVRETTGVAAGVREFERVQRASSQLRDVTTELATREARAKQIEQELARRESAASGLALHMQRLTGVKLPI
jgi:predicted negative regulator of RcsB-dependent stress response